jgi:hypothetical protein
MLKDKIFSVYHQKLSGIVLAILLFTFLAKGLFFVALFPLFQGPDEQVHYTTIQQRAEPKEKTWPIEKLPETKHDGKDISTYNFSEETTKSAQAVQFDEVKFQGENTQIFSEGSSGPGESAIKAHTWKPYIDTYPAATSGTDSIYYTLATWMEKWLASESLLARFFSIRMLSLLFGLGVVWLAYLTARRVNLSEWQSLVLAVLIAFQPMFTATSTMVNIDIALIFAFSLFVYAAAGLLSDAFRWRDAALLLLAVGLGVFSKGPGIVLAVVAAPLLVWVGYTRFPERRRLLTRGGGAALIIACALLAFVGRGYLANITNFHASSKFDSPLTSLMAYGEKTLDRDGFFKTAASYWGHFGWLDTPVSDTALHVIWNLEIIALAGVILFLLTTNPQPYLPRKQYIIFSLGIIIALQLAIRFYDWRVFDATKQVLIGTPGRYFLPNIIPHMLFLATGLGFFTRTKRQFDILLKALLVLMALFSLYAMFNVILPRYYL